MKKLLLVALVSMMCINSYAQTVNPEKELRKKYTPEQIEQIRAEILKNIQEKADVEAGNKKELTEEEAEIESAKFEKEQQEAFKVLMSQYNTMESKDKIKFRKKIAKQAVQFFKEYKEMEPLNKYIPLVTGDAEKVQLKYSDTYRGGELSQEQSERIIKAFTKGVTGKACSDPQIKTLIGLDIPMDIVLNINDKELTRKNMSKTDCPNTDFLGK
jgi:hypothetical protein